MNIIVSVDQNGCIGNENDLLYDIKEDKKYFKDITIGTAVVMGRKTWESIPRKPLPNRMNIIISRTLTMTEYPNTFIYDSFDSFMLNVKHNQFINPTTSQYYNIFIIGGSQIYGHVLQNYEVDTIYKTLIEYPEPFITVLSHPIYFPKIEWDKFNLINTASLTTSNYKCKYHTIHYPIKCTFQVFSSKLKNDS
jgi:dihydrofolate reductase